MTKHWNEYSGVGDRVRAFHEQHGDCVNYGRSLLFADGARRDADPMGAMSDPPDDDLQHWQIILKYREIKLAQAVTAFDHRKLEIADDPDSWTKEEELLKELNALQAAVKRWQKKAESAREKVRFHSPGYQSPELRKRLARMDVATENAKSRFQQKLDGIDI